MAETVLYLTLGTNDLTRATRFCDAALKRGLDAPRLR